MAKKLKTNEDLVKDLMNYSPHGALAQGFIMQAITYYCQEVKEWEPTEKERTRGLINPDAWKAVAEDIDQRMKDFYDKQNGRK